MSEIILYEDGTLSLKTTVENETVWLSQKQMAELFDKSVKTINEHIKNIYREKELEKNVTIRKFRIVQKEGQKEVSREIEHYSLDVIISVGYRVKSKRRTRFRIWANRVLKEYILKGYAPNQERLQAQKLKELEQTIALIKQGIENQELSLQEAKGFVEIIRAYLFVLFLHKNSILHKPNGETRINDNALASLILLVASSDPVQKEIIIKSIMNILTEEVKASSLNSL